MGGGNGEASSNPKFLKEKVLLFYSCQNMRGGGAITPTLPPSSDGSVTEFIASAESSELLKMVRVHQT